MSFFELSIRPKIILAAIITAFILRVTGYGAQLWQSAISINAAQVPSTQTDFPVLVSVTDARFKTVGNGGHVADANGYDIRPYTDTTLGTAITGYELERYNATTGEVVMWVKVGSLISSSTPIVLGYGDTGLTTDGSSTTTWSNGFISVYHLKDGTTFSVTDSVGAHNGTNHSATATTGQVDGAGAFVSASSQYVDAGSYTGPSVITLSAWINATSFPGAYNNIMGRFVASPLARADMYVKSTGKLAMFCQAGSSTFSYDGTGSTTLSTSTWYLITMTYSNGGGTTPGVRGYVNATADGTSGNTSNDLVTTSASMFLGQQPPSGGLYWNGKIDEARVSSVTRSADWITTEYNNEVAPGTFETLGTEGTPTSAATGNFFLLFP